MSHHDDTAAFRARFDALAAIGRDPATGGCNRLAWTAADAQAGAWFAEQAAGLGLHVERDANGNRWAWWLPDGVSGPDAVPERSAVATGSHLDTVRDGGAFDGALGVVTAFGALASLQAEGARPRRPVAVVAWADEEGARYGTPCLGSKLAAGMLDPVEVAERTDADGVALADAIADAGLDPDRLGPDPDRLARLAAYLELHVEQGRGLVFADAPVGVGTGVWPHGRWRLTAHGETNHAGTTRMADRRDPMHVLAELIAAAREEAVARDALATVGRVRVHPNGPNAVPGRVTAWLDARGADADTVRSTVEAVGDRAEVAAQHTATSVEVTAEAWSQGVAFDAELHRTLARATAAVTGRKAPELATAAGHDAAILAPQVPAGMLYVRNPTGVSHSPAEHAEVADCVTGQRALAAALGDLAT